MSSITPNSGYTNKAWSTTSGATSGYSPGTSYTVSSNVKLYGNAWKTSKGTNVVDDVSKLSSISGDMTSVADKLDSIFDEIDKTTN